MSAGQTDRQVLDKLQEALFGLGKIYGPYKQKNRKHSDYFYWRTTRFEEVQAVVALLWNWLSPVKRNAAIAALRGCR